MVIKMPTVHVNVWKGFKEEHVKYLIENLTKVFVDLDIPAQAVEILIHEVPQSHWGIGGKQASEIFKDVDMPTLDKTRM
jgi:4-oxalocrotonate tautomerase